MIGAMMACALFEKRLMRMSTVIFSCPRCSRPRTVAVMISRDCSMMSPEPSSGELKNLRAMTE